MLLPEGVKCQRRIFRKSSEIAASNRVNIDKQRDRSLSHRLSNLASARHLEQGVLIRLRDSRVARDPAGHHLPANSAGMRCWAAAGAVEARSASAAMVEVHKAHPAWSGDQLYDYARAIVTAEIENITYKEFLPNLLGSDAIAPYRGYDPSVDPRLTLEFNIAFRFGHPWISPPLTSSASTISVSERSTRCANRSASPDIWISIKSQAIRERGRL
jgi:Animal haem peroxidase